MARLIILFLFSVNAYAGEFHLVQQTGSYSGFFTGGIGYETPYYTPEVLVGYVPSVVGGEDIYSITSKNSFHYNMCMAVPLARCIRPYAGLSFVFSLFDSDTWIKQPDQYPDGYYPPNGVRTAPFVGLELITSGKHSLYIEAAALDLYLETWVRSDGAMDIRDASTYGFGWKVDL